MTPVLGRKKLGRKSKTVIPIWMAANDQKDPQATTDAVTWRSTSPIRCGSARGLTLPR